MEESVCITNDPQEGTVAIIAKGFRQRERNPRQHTRARVADGDRSSRAYSNANAKHRGTE